MFMTSFRESADHVTTPSLWYRVEAEEKENNCAHACRDAFKALHKSLIRALSTPFRNFSIYSRVRAYRAGLGVTRHQGTTSNAWDMDNPGEHVSVKHMECI